MSRHVLQQVVCVCLCTIALVAGLSAGRAQNPPNSPPAQQKPDSRTAFIAGTVVDASTKKGVPGVTVQLNRISGARAAANSANLPVVTDAQGRFYFAQLLAATYTFTAIKPGWGPVSLAAQQRSVELADGERNTTVIVSLVHQGAISGVVRDDVGDVVVGTKVTAFQRAQVNGRSSYTPAGGATTDDRGMYRLSGLTPGAYLVCACDRDPVPFDGTVLTTLAAEPVKLMALASRAAKVGADVASLDDTLRTYAPVFYPASPTVARAERISVGSGEERSAVDITTNAVRAFRVSGTVVGVEGLNAQGMALIASGESDEGAMLTRIPPMVVQPGGRFDFVNVPPGIYTLRVVWSPTMPAAGPTGSALAFIGGRGAGVTQPGPAYSPQQAQALQSKTAFVTVGVSDRDVTDLVVTMQAGATFSGRVKMVNDAPLPGPQELQRLLVLLQPTNPQLGSLVVNPMTPPSPDGTFRIVGVPPGRYRLTVASTPSAPTLKSVEIGGADAVDQPIDISGDVTDVAITMSATTPASIRGTVTGSGIAEGLTALFFPADRKLWTAPDSAIRRFRALPVTRKGEFTFNNAPPGEYLMLVVPDLQGVDWQDPDRLEELSRTAQRIVLAEGERKTVEVKR